MYTFPEAAVAENLKLGGLKQLNSLLGVYPEKRRPLIWKDTHSPVFTAALFTTAEMWKRPACPVTGDWVKKMRCKDTVEHYSAGEKN